MTTCFVIQPFDSGKYDKRFDDVYKPAILEADLEPYRVDRDPGVDIPIDSIEQGIRSALVCLADITTDNPNVWYELGFAFATGKPVMMLCGEERTGKKYPFDIQHRTVTPYLADSPSDFANLKTAITKRLKVLASRDVVIKEISESQKMAPVDGLTQPELIVLASTAASALLPDQGVPVHEVRNDVERSGFTRLGFSMGVRGLTNRKFIRLQEQRSNYDGEMYPEIVLLPSAWDWIEMNQSKFLIEKIDGAPF